jgi:uncharacterized protein
MPGRCVASCLIFFTRGGISKSITGLDFVSDGDFATIIPSLQDMVFMAKLILIAIAVWLIITLLKRYRRHLDDKPQTRSPMGESMVQCAHCGLHLPESDSICAAQQYFCCQDHADAHHDQHSR